jgi:hypothetical protein
MHILGREAEGFYEDDANHKAFSLDEGLPNRILPIF